MRNVDWAMFTFLNHMVVDAGIGLIPGQPLEAQIQAFQAYFSDTPMGETRRARALEVVNTQRTEFQAHDLEIGFAYAEGALVADGSDAPPRDPMGSIYFPTTRPGHRLPHAWIEGEGATISTHDLAGNNANFVLITGAAGDGWSEAGQLVKDTFGVQVTLAKIAADGTYTDPSGTWQNCDRSTTVARYWSAPTTTSLGDLPASPQIRPTSFSARSEPSCLAERDEYTSATGDNDVSIPCGREGS